jgi:hypothetical protein
MATGIECQFYKADGSHHLHHAHSICFYKYEDGKYWAKDSSPSDGAAMCPYPEEGVTPFLHSVVIMGDDGKGNVNTALKGGTSKKTSSKSKSKDKGSGKSAPGTGSVLGRQTFQGYADDSAWARGQAWALFGYAMMARLEMDPEIGRPEQARAFNDIAYKLAEWIIPHLPDDGVPFWDFSQNDLRDASAGAIIACGLLKIWRLRDCPADDSALTTAERILRTLASPEYLAEPRTNGGFLLKHSVGNIPGHSEVDVPLTYADYYFLEALNLHPSGR